MLVSEPALLCLGERLRRWFRPDPTVTAVRTDGAPAAAPAATAASSEEAGAGEAGRQPAAAAQRRAEAAALRAHLHARQGRHDAAADAFVEALGHAPDVDLTAAPAFWLLPRGGHEAAVRAYRAVGREREALHLSVRIEQRFRPRAVGVRRDIGDGGEQRRAGAAT